MNVEIYRNNLGEIPKRLNPTEETLKILYLKSGNECAYPDCENSMYKKETLIGQVCHIEDAKPGGRYNPNKSNEENRIESNLMLMCYEHHVLTNDPGEYPVQLLQKMKSKHELDIVESKRSPKGTEDEFIAALKIKRNEELIKVSEYFNTNVTDTEWFHFFDYFKIIEANGAIINSDYRIAFFGAQTSSFPFPKGFTTYNYCENRQPRIRTKHEWKNYNYCEIFTSSKHPSAMRSLTLLENSVLLDDDILLLIKKFKRLASDNISIIRANLIQYAKTDIKTNDVNALHYCLGQKDGYRKLNKLMEQRELILANIKSGLYK